MGAAPGPDPGRRGGQPSTACKFVFVGLADHAEPDTIRVTTGERWRTALVGHLQPWGIGPQHAVALAELIMAVFEGALVLSRAARSSVPFWNTIETLITTVGCLVAEPQP